MRIRRVQNRVYKGKEYERWLVTIPPELMKEMGWDEKTELEAKKRGGTLRLARRPPEQKAP
jgi:bifunctional DNA-binding transcriptional regulator/antitoxin component of YhaV-PrlF toxin-antitoxin module